MKNLKNSFEILSSIKATLPIKEEVVRPSDTSVSMPIKEGDKIVRPVVFFNTGRKLVLSPTFTKNEKKAAVIRVSPPFIGKFFTKHSTATNDKNGLVCFCNANIPENWIYFTIEKLAKSKNYAIVSFKKGTEEELFELYDFPKK